MVGTLLGARVTEVAIWSGPPVSGRVALTGLDADDVTRDQFALVRQIVYLLSGPLAEQIASGGAGLIMNEPASLVASALMAGLRDPSSVDRARTCTWSSACCWTISGRMARSSWRLPSITCRCTSRRCCVIAGARLSRWQSACYDIGRLTHDQFHALFAEALPGAEMAALLDPSSA